jgi:hypothetical protein
VLDQLNHTAQVLQGIISSSVLPWLSVTIDFL